MPTKAQFETARNAQYQPNTGQVKPGPCQKEDKTGKVCGYQPTDYMDFVDHRETVHGIPRGAADDYTITKGNANWKPELSQ